MCIFLSNLLLLSIPFSFRICINLIQFSQSNAFYQSMKQAHNPSSMSRVHFYFILSVPIVSLGHFPLQNPNWSFPSTSLTFLSIFLSILTTIFAVCVMVTAFCSFWLLLQGSLYTFSEIRGPLSSYGVNMEEKIFYAL